jgi:hypothetical protein
MFRAPTTACSREGGFPATDRDFATAPPPDHERTLAAAKAIGVEFIGPPPFSEDAVLQTSGLGRGSG